MNPQQTLLFKYDATKCIYKSPTSYDISPIMELRGGSRHQRGLTLLPCVRMLATLDAERIRSARNYATDYLDPTFLTWGSRRLHESPGRSVQESKPNLGILRGL